MKNSILLSILLCSFISFIGCKSGSNHEEAKADSTILDVSKIVADSTKVAVNNNEASSSAAVISKIDSTRKFIRTAELKFKVKSVIKTTYEIEDITNKHGGFVTNTNLSSNIESVNNNSISEDSTLETTTFNVTNTIILRVPNYKLDTTLKDIAKQIDYLDYRIIKADDVGLQLLTNKLSEKRLNKHAERIEAVITSKGNKLNDISDAEDKLLSSQQQKDEASLSNLTLQDQINFSTITIYLYQRSSVKREIIATNSNIHHYEISFIRRAWESIQSGWYVLESILIELLKMWALILTLIIAWVLYKKYRKNKLRQNKI